MKGVVPRRATNAPPATGSSTMLSRIRPWVGSAGSVFARGAPDARAPTAMHARRSKPTSRVMVRCAASATVETTCRSESAHYVVRIDGFPNGCRGVSWYASTAIAVNSSLVTNVLAVGRSPQRSSAILTAAPSALDAGISTMRRARHASTAVWYASSTSGSEVAVPAGLSATTVRLGDECCRGALRPETRGERLSTER